MELADIIVVNKADGERVAMANNSKKQFENALSLLQYKIAGWTPKVLTCSGLNGTGIEEIWNTILQFVKLTKESGYFDENRRKQEKNWFDQKSKKLILDTFINNTEMYNILLQLKKDINENKIKPLNAIKKLKSSLKTVSSRN